MTHESFNELRRLRNEFAHNKITQIELSQKLEELGLFTSENGMVNSRENFSYIFDSRRGLYFTPEILRTIFSRIVEDKTAEIILDPWAGFGDLISTIQETVNPKKSLAITQVTNEGKLGEILVDNTDWKVGDPLILLKEIPNNIDIVASVLPFGRRGIDETIITTRKRKRISLKDDFGNLILVASSQKLKKDGIGLFVVLGSFFFSQRSVLRHFEEIGLNVEAALYLPPGTFSPYTYISSYLIIVRKRPISKMFVAQISTDSSTNEKIFYNLKNGIESDNLELGRFVETVSFSGIDSLKIQEQLNQKAVLFGSPAIRLEELIVSINLGRHDPNFKFPQIENALFIPLIGNSDVIDSPDNFSLKSQNYAQVAIDGTRSNSHFVAKFLNSELGREFRESQKTGAVIRKLNKRTLKDILIFIPDFDTQKKMIEIEGKIVAEQNILTGLQTELIEYKRDIWSNPKSTEKVEQNLSVLSKRISGKLKQHADSGLEQWFDSLPYPLASILRAWQTTPGHDYKGKYDLLQDFFEATAEFSSIIFLSAFKSNERFLEIPKKIKQKKPSEFKRMSRINLSNISFGTWKEIVENFGGQTRDLLSGDKDKKALCAEIFADPSLNLPQCLSRPEFLQILSTTKKLRNDWKGHGGRMGNTEAKILNDLLIAELHKLREIFSDSWYDIQLIQPKKCTPHSDAIENEISILMGSNIDFFTEVRSTSIILYADRLYIMPKNGKTALKLHPLIRIGSPKSTNTACYFFNRLDDEGVRFISYHHTDPSEYKLPLDRAEEIKKIFAS